MYKYFILGYLVLFGVSCKPEQDSPTEMQSARTTMASTAADVSTPVPDTNAPIESFSDDSNIGRPHKNKVQIDIIAQPTSDEAYKPNNLAVIRFFTLTTKKVWELKQTLELESHALAGTDPKIEDFNNDGLKDITFVSDTAARGANEVRTLLIYNKRDDILVQVKNSQNYPNLAYNKTLKCIDSWMVHGASTTVFLRLEGELLKEFASVGTGANQTGSCCGLEATLTDSNGVERVIRRQKITEDDIYTRFRTFNPPQP